MYRSSWEELWLEKIFARVRGHCFSDSALNITKLSGSNINAASLALIYKKMPKQGKFCPPNVWVKYELKTFLCFPSVGHDSRKNAVSSHKNSSQKEK